MGENDKILFSLSEDSLLTYEDLKAMLGDEYSLEEYCCEHSRKDLLAQYIEQVIQDLNSMAQAGPPDYLFGKTIKKGSYPLEEDFSDHDFAGLFVTKDMTFAEIFGLEKVIFPSPEKLSPRFVWELSLALDVLLNSYNILVILPEGNADEMLYYWLWEIWDRKKISYGCLGAIIEVGEEEVASLGLHG